MDRIEKKVQNFVVGNRMHAQSVNLYGVLAELFRHMTDEGFAPYKRFINTHSPSSQRHLIRRSRFCVMLVAKVAVASPTIVLNAILISTLNVV